MIASLKDHKQISRLREMINDAEKVVIVTHKAPDGDAVGSSLALAKILDKIGKEARVILPDMLPPLLLALPDAKEAMDATRYPAFAHKLIAEADLIMCLDFNTLSRTGALEPHIQKATARKALIDHHESPDDFAEVSISHPETSSTCYLLFKVLCALELFLYIDKPTAECLMTGMMTDTGNFSYNSADPDLYIVVSELLKKGVDKERIYREQFETHSLNSMRLNAYAISEKMEIFPEYGASLITLSREELNRFRYVKGDTENLVNKPLAIPDVVYSAYMREEENNIKVSMRSLGAFPVNEICREHFGGGGHVNAAGGEFKGSLKEAAKLFRSLLKTNKDLYLGHK